MKKHFTLISILVLGIVYLWPIISMKVKVYDEGIILTGAARILNGDLPFKDFWSVYPPGQYYVLAMLFKIFGSSVFVERVYDLVVKLALSVSGFFIIRYIIPSKKLALAGWFLSLVVIGHKTSPGYPIYPALLLLNIAIIFCLRFLDTSRYFLLICCSIFITIAALFRHDLAAYGAISLLFVLTLHSFILKKTNPGKTIFFYISAFLILSIPVAVIALANVELKAMFDQLILIPADIMTRFRWLPYPPLAFKNGVFYLVPCIAVFGLCLSLVRIFKCSKDGQENYGILILSLLGIFFFNQARVRSDFEHLLPMVYICTILVTIYMSLAAKTGKIMNRGILYFVLATTIGMIYAAPMVKKIKGMNTDYSSLKISSNVPKAGYSKIDIELDNVIHHIQNNSSSNDFIYVGVTNHDKFIFNHSVIYYLASRKCATRFHEFDPGVSNTLDAQNMIVKELTISSPKLIILTDSWQYEPNGTNNDFNIDLIDEYIRQHYEIDVQFGEYEIWRKKI